ncbi:methyltransferase domain-containing protein [Candidatus Micrarchaeota archaeon]|nr:methyltransferase domain-containing protein [Candidatus Micrarchaeota archaeon]
MIDINIFEKLKRGPQVVVLKDAAIIAGFAGIGAGDTVVEAGTGSGFLAIFLANVVGENGRIYSYEWREDFAKLAAKNFEKMRVEKVIELKQKNVFDGIEEKEVDAVILDLADSDKAVGHVFNALHGGGVLVGFHPNVEQIKKFTDACKEAGFVESHVVETIVRDWLVRERGCRPANTGLMHTAFLSFHRKPQKL